MTGLLTTKVTGIILAGGASSRWSGYDKAFAKFNDVPLIEHVINRLQPQVNEIVIIANRNFAKYERYGFTVLSDAIDGQLGPLAGIFTGMLFAQQRSSSYFFTVPCDAPVFPSNLVACLLETLKLRDVSLCVPADQEYIHWVFLLGKTELLEDLEKFLNLKGRKLSIWVKKHPHSIVPFINKCADFINVNGPIELDVLNKKFGAFCTPHN